MGPLRKPLYSVMIVYLVSNGLHAVNGIVAEFLKAKSDNSEKEYSGRRRRDCPIKGCHSCQLIQLSTHLKHVHGIKDPIKRKELLRKIRTLISKCIIQHF